MKKYKVSYEGHDHERYVDEVMAVSKEEAIELAESNNDDCYTALFAELID